MSADKYILPEVASLKNLGFVFEYGKLNEVIPYIRSFINTNLENLVFLYFPDQSYHDENGNTIDIRIWADPNIFEDVFINEQEKELIEKIIRIEQGDINYKDHLLLVHPKDRKNKEILLKALNKKIRSLYGATGNLIYRRGIWVFDFDECVKECLYHKVLDDIILGISYEGKIKPSEWTPQYLKYSKKKKEADKFKKDNPSINKRLSVLSKYHEAEKELKTLSDEMFSSNLTLEKNARILMRKAMIGIPIITFIEKKEKTISYYLGLQAKSVNVSKDNSKSNKGIQQKKRQAVLDLHKADTNKSIAQILIELPPDIKVNRKTASKYIREYKNG